MAADELEDLADDAGKPGDGKPGDGKPPKKKDHKQAIIAIASVFAVIIGWMGYRSSKAKSSGQGATPGAATNPYLAAAAQQQANGGNVAGYGDPSASAGFNSLMQNMQAEIEALAAQITPSGTSTTPVSTPPPIITNPPPGPGSKYTIRGGDTLNKITMRLYGNSSAAAINSLRVQNPWLKTVSSPTSDLGYYSGNQIGVPLVSQPPPAKKK